MNAQLLVYNIFKSTIMIFIYEILRLWESIMT